MFALKQIHEDTPDVIPVPEPLRHRRTEVIFIALDDLPSRKPESGAEHPLMAFAGAFGTEDEVALSAVDEEVRARRGIHGAEHANTDGDCRDRSGEWPGRGDPQSGAFFENSRAGS